MARESASMWRRSRGVTPPASARARPIASLAAGTAPRACRPRAWAAWPSAKSGSASRAASNAGSTPALAERNASTPIRYCSAALSEVVDSNRPARSSNITAALDHRVGRQKGLVDLDTEARLLQRPHATVLADPVGLAAELVAEEIVPGHIGLEIAGIVDGGQKMDAGGHVEAGHRGVRVDGKLPGRSQGRDAQRFRDPAGLGEIGLQDGDHTVLDDAGELEARVVVLAGGQGHAGEGGRLRIAPVIVGRKGLFEPADSMSLQSRHGLARIRHGVAGIGVGENGQPLSEGLAHRRHALEVTRGSISDTELDRLVASLDVDTRLVHERRGLLVAERDATGIGRDRARGATEKTIE